MAKIERLAHSGCQPAAPTSACVHDSLRTDGALDDHCLLCGVEGYWHDGHRHDWTHPSGKALFVLKCQAFHTKGVGVGVRV